MQQPCVIEVLDEPNATDGARGASVLARLAEREEQRAASTAKRLEDLQVSADPRESVETFLQDFAAKRQATDTALQQLATAPGGGGAAELAALTGQLADLEKVGWHVQALGAGCLLPAVNNISTLACLHHSLCCLHVEKSGMRPCLHHFLCRS